MHSCVYLMYIVLVYRYKIYNNLDEREQLPYQPGLYAHNLSIFQDQLVSVSACSIIYQTTICHTPCTIVLTLCFNLGLTNISNFMIRHRGHVGFNVSQNLVVNVTKFHGSFLKNTQHQVCPYLSYSNINYDSYNCDSMTFAYGKNHHLAEKKTSLRRSRDLEEVNSSATTERTIRHLCHVQHR